MKDAVQNPQGSILLASSKNLLFKEALYYQVPTVWLVFSQTLSELIL